MADEPISMLDMSVRAKILQLMLDLKNDLGLTYVYITHDLATAKFFCDRVAIMYLGRIVEIGPTEEIFADPKHPYTKALLQGDPRARPDRMVPRDLPRGEIPDAANPPLGCSFHPRCPEASRSAAGSRATCGRCSRSTGPAATPRSTSGSRRLVGDLDRLDEPAKSVTIGVGRPRRGRAPDARRRSAQERPDEPLWRGVGDISEGSGRRRRSPSTTGVDPALRRSGGVEVACILHPTPVTLEPVRPERAS